MHPLWLGHTGVSKSDLSTPSLQHSLQAVWAFIPRHRSQGGFCSLVSLCSSKAGIPVSRLSLQSWGQWFALWPPFCSGYQKKVIFLNLFSLLFLVGWSGFFRAPHMQNMKLEVALLYKYGAHQTHPRLGVYTSSSSFWNMSSSKFQMACSILRCRSLWKYLPGGIFLDYPHFESIPSHFPANLKQEFFLA